jgi:hypothetical protein
VTPDIDQDAGILAVIDAWRAAAGQWRHFSKFSLLAQTRKLIEATAPRAVDVSWAPAPGDTALIVDLPGTESVEVGCALCELGYSPVVGLNTSRGGFNERVPTQPLVSILIGAGLKLLKIMSKRGAPEQPAKNRPPAFLLDENRAPAPVQRPIVPPIQHESRFDNGWFVLPGDFPSAAALGQAGIKRVAVVCRGRVRNEDLLDVLAKYRGMEMFAIDLDQPVPSRLPRLRPAVLRWPATARRWMARRPDGTYGSVVIFGGGAGG